MFAQASQVLQSLEGTFVDQPLALLLRALHETEQTGALDIRRNQLEKRIFFDEGAPVACRSNLLHETLGKFLVEKGKLTDVEYHKALSESVQQGRDIGEVLVAQGKIAPFDLYKLLQQNFALAILDCFRWTDASYRFVPGETPPSGAHTVRMNPVQLVFTGVVGMMPFETLATHFAFTDEQRFGRTALSEPSELKLSGKETRVLQALKGLPNFSELRSKVSAETEDAMRRLFAFCLLGLATFAEGPAPGEAMPAPPADIAPPPPVEPAAVAAAPAPTPAAPEPVKGLPFLDDNQAAVDALLTAFLEHRTKDPFALLGVPEEANHAALRAAFLKLAEQSSPQRFSQPELREKAEQLLLAYARAFGVLSDEELKSQWRKRRAALRAKAQAPPPPQATQQAFQVQAGALLDAATQMESGQKRMAEQNYRGALRYFEYAWEIEPKALHKAYCAWARFRMSPQAHGKLALTELQEALRLDAQCEQAWFILGEVQREMGDTQGAETSYRRAFKLNPKERRYAELIQQMVRGAR
ncbi:MAG: DUF4388 domain-containing protein [Myxococcaceae bacterium]